MVAGDRTDRELVSLAREGADGAFTTLVRRHGRMAHAVALAVLGRVDDAEDACQDAWLRVLEHLDDCRDPDRFPAWLARIVRNVSLNQLARRRVRSAAPLEEVFGEDGPPGASDPAAEAARSRGRERLQAALARLSEAQREVVVLHDLAGWTHAEIAAHVRSNENLSRQRLFEARRKLRTLLHGDEREEAGRERG